MPGCKTYHIIKIEDDFSHGINADTWTIVNKKWGKNNNGVVWQNVGYTKKGELILNAHGDYYTGNILGYKSDSGKRVGAAICTKDALGPGRYEVSAKLLPRFGVCNAFWTYALINDINSEIDIEFGIKNDYSNVMFSNWHTEKKYANKKTILDTYHNDGQWHTYRFDWYTYPQKKIDYYIDGKLIHTATTFIPTVAANFWIGVWFPDKWAGEPNFDSDFMLVDWFKYSSFKNNPYTKNTKVRTCPRSFFPIMPTNPQRNIISNNHFINNIGWKITGNVFLDTKGLNLNNGMVKQVINHIYPNRSYLLALDYLGKDVKVILKCFDKKNIELGDILLELPTSETITNYTKNIEIPINTNSFIISFSGSEAIINNPILNFSN